MIDASHISLLGVAGAVLVLVRLWNTTIKPIIHHRKITDARFELVREFMRDALAEKEAARFERLWKELGE